MGSRPLLAAAAAALAIAGLAAWAIAGEGEGPAAAAVTLRVVGAASLLAIGAGLPAALLLARWRSPLRPFVEALLLAPLVLPPTVTGFALAMLLGRGGPLGDLGLVFTWRAAAVAAAVVAFPLFLRAARPALSAVDEGYAHLARSLGAGRGEVLARITLPLAAPGLLAGAALAVGRALGEFGATLMVAGNIPGATRTLPLAVYSAFAAGDDATAFSLSLVLVALAVLLVGAAALFEGERRNPATGADVPHPAPPRVHPLGPGEGGGLALRSVRAAAGAFHLGPIDLEVPGAGGTCAILGPSGAGKSTLLAALAGALPAAGELRLGDGANLLDLPPERRRIGWVPQGGRLFPHLRVDENVGFGVPRPARAQRVAEALELVGAAHLARRDPRSLSGGERMRVALARAIAARPRLLLLDEPLAALDPGSREALLHLLAALPRQLGGTPILHVTHEFAEAFRLAGHLAVLLGGRIAAAGAPGTIFARPPSAEVAAFLRVDNVLAGDLAPEGPDLSLFRHGDLALHVAGAFSGPGWIAFDGSALLLAAAPPPGASARNVLEAEVIEIAPLRRGLLVSLRCCGAELRARLTPDAREALALAPGSRVAVLLKATAPQVIPREAPG